ncbi:MarR family winged helix-turn-helix transcriptional regulator [Sorangium sp. So ce131]|uniref:MarR family winged helix-turn-helix transcriptional regulator n=1 Tax=Sorangium sp. So ce131 TaxID=3133282 RepID=UPI003F5F21FC
MRDQFTAEGAIVLDNAFGYWVARVYLASRAEMYRRFRAHGVEITPEQWMVLVRLWEQEGVTQTHLAGRTFRDVPTMSRILALMERDGLVARREDPTDRRARLVYLTARGRHLQKALSSEARAMVGELLSGIPEDDLLVTRRTLQRILANIEPER